MKGLMLFLALLVSMPGIARAQSEMLTGKATPQEVYQKVAEAARFLVETGEKGLKEFENPKGRFVWKDTFVWVTECEKNYCLPTPKSRDIGLSLSHMKCRLTGKLYVLSLCDDMAAHPTGSWVEHWQPKPGSDSPARKVSFMMQVPNSPYQVVSDVFDDTTPLEQLQEISRRR